MSLSVADFSLLHFVKSLSAEISSMGCDALVKKYTGYPTGYFIKIVLPGPIDSTLHSIGTKILRFNSPLIDKSREFFGHRTTIFVIVPIAEELLFRAGIQKFFISTLQEAPIDEWVGIATSTLLTAMIFAYSHPDHRNSDRIAGEKGSARLLRAITRGYFFNHGSIYEPILTHATNNIAAFALELASGES